MSIQTRLQKLEQVIAESKDSLNLIFQIEKGKYEYNGKIISEQDIEKIKGIKIILIDDYGEDEL